MENSKWDYWFMSSKAEKWKKEIMHGIFPIQLDWTREGQKSYWITFVIHIIELPEENKKVEVNECI